MALILALKNRDSLVVASDTTAATDSALKFGQFMNLPGRAILLMAGNIEAVRAPIETMVIPRLTPTSSAATIAQLIQAALVLEVVPHLPEITGRVELIVAGIDPIRHTQEPGLYYLDSAQDFYLKAVTGNVVGAGSTAVIGEVVAGRDLLAATTDELMEVAKECLTATKLRWPAALAAHQRFGVITATQIRVTGF